jgi:hypothetical protein
MSKKETIGSAISEGLVAYENILWDFEANVGLNPNFTDDGFRAALKIFMSALMGKMFELQINEYIPQKQAEEMAESAGQEIRRIVKTYTGIDTHELYQSPTV